MSPRDPSLPSTAVHKGRGAVSNPEGRFEALRAQPFDDGWDLEEAPESSPQTTVTAEPAKSLVTRNDSPDISFDRSINPYKGCEHGCIYCYARPSHGYLNLSSGLDFETRLIYKPNAAELLEKEFRRPGYQPELIVLGTNTDPYQPVERRLGVTRRILEVMLRYRHPVGITTKGAALLERDLDLFKALAADRLIEVGITLTTLDPALKRSLEPRAASPQARLRAMRMLADAGVPVRAMFSPVIPFVNDAELEAALGAAAGAGATMASYTFLRLPHEVKTLFREWLDVHYPLKAEHVMSIVQQSRGGKDYDPAFGRRMRGEGPFAELIAQRFRLAVRRFGLLREHSGLSRAAFRVPEDSAVADATQPQLRLF